MGREPKQGMEGKQEQGQPWDESQIKGWKAGAATAMGREPKQGTDGKQEQGNRGKVLTHGTDNSKATGAKCLRTGRTIAGWQGQSAYARNGQQGSMGREPSQGAEGSRAAWAESLRRGR